MHLHFKYASGSDLFVKNWGQGMKITGEEQWWAVMSRIYKKETEEERSEDSFPFSAFLLHVYTDSQTHGPHCVVGRVGSFPLRLQSDLHPDSNTHLLISLFWLLWDLVVLSEKWDQDPRVVKTNCHGIFFPPGLSCLFITLHVRTEFLNLQLRGAFFRSPWIR